ncbi:MAG: B12-binding domain-containing radical SAM protein [Candidatus Omnitrophica bacterium]|nr:B12-binding domain-containing radical SAM protein [Candidatus Omnitrophota bacterium]
MKVLFINRYLSKETIYREPLGIMSLASAIKHKHKVFVLEPTKENIDEKIAKIRPEVIGYSVRTGFHQYYLNLNKKLKKKYNFISVFGGPHATFFPEMINEDGVDCVCRGESEEAFLEFLDISERKGDITKVRNFRLKKSKKIYKNDCRPLVQDLDKLRFPDRSLFDSCEQIRNAKVRSFMTGKGCPFNCSYCFNAELKRLYAGQRYVRRRSVENVIKEVKAVKEAYDIKVAIFEDDTFNLDKNWLREFSNRFRELKLKLICIGIRPDLVDEEVVKLLKEANCVSIIFGVESGSEIIRKEVLYRNITNEQIINCAKLLKKYNIYYVTENILAVPGSSLEDDLKTLKLNIICKPNYSITHIMQPYPSTKIYQLAVKQGMYNKNSFDDLDSFYNKSALKIDNKLERENLQSLFPLTVNFPFIYPGIRWLIKLRLRFFYSLLHIIYKSYVGTKWIPYKRSIREYASLFRRYFLNR